MTPKGFPWIWNPSEPQQRASFVVRSAESRNSGADIPGAGEDSRRLAEAARRQGIQCWCGSKVVIGQHVVVETIHGVTLTGRVTNKLCSEGHPPIVGRHDHQIAALELGGAFPLGADEIVRIRPVSGP